MMSKKQWVALLAVYIAYLLMGAGVFYSIEGPLEHHRRAEELLERETILRLVRTYYDNNETELLDQVARYCGRPFSTEPADMEDLEPELWTFYNSFFFVVTVVSTIGYGNLAPTSMLSRILMILYALLGIPLNGILLASLAEFFSNTLIRARARHKNQSSATLLTDLARYLLPGAVVFLLLPGALFAYVEDWGYDKGVYYAFVTLTTIGFGDIVAGQTSRAEDGPYLAYRVALIVWIVFGLGYVLMLLGLITRAMRGKRVARLEHALAQQLRGAERRVARDLRYMRRVLNELYLQKLKPVYRDDEASSVSGLRARSNSEPSLSGVLAAMPRRSRACSEGAALSAYRYEVESVSLGGGGGAWKRRSLVRVSSDSELSRIDRAATFAAPEAAVAPARLLARFVSALGGGPATQGEQDEQSPVPRLHPGAAALGGGVHGFTDADILRSEQRPAHWTVGASGRDSLAQGGWPSPPPAYDAAAGLDSALNGGTGPAEWTWSAPAAASQLVHGLARARKVAGNAALKAAEACAEAAAAADTTPWWPPASAAPGVGPSFDAPPGAQRSGKRHSISSVLHNLYNKSMRPLRRTMEGVPPTPKKVRPPSPTPRPRPKSKSVADVFFFNRPQEDDAQQEAEARVDALLEGTSIADLFRAVDALRRRDAAARAARGQGEDGAESSSSSSCSTATSASSAAGVGGGDSPRGRCRRKNGTATTTPPYASLTSLFVPPEERRRRSLFVPSNAPAASQHSPALPPHALLRRASASPAVLGAWGSERRPSLRPGGGVAAALLARRPSAPQAISLNLPPGSPRQPSAAGSYFKRSAPRRFSVRPVPHSALVEGAETTGEGQEAVGTAPPPQPPPLPPTAPAAMMPLRARDLRTQVLQRQLTDSGVTARRRRDSLQDVIVQKP